MDTPKYAVLKWDDWKRVRDAAESRSAEPVRAHAFLVVDAEVIRKQDITSGPIFHTYASVMMTYAELIGNVGVNRAEYERLMAIADHFHVAAINADTTRREGRAKLPD